MSLAAIILDLEQQLLDPAVRSSPHALRRLLSVDFMEFGSSGNRYDRQQIIEILPQQAAAAYTITDFQVHRLGSDVVLATYRLIRTDDTGAITCSLRSSVWRYREGHWQMYFHQGTPAAEHTGRG